MVYNALNNRAPVYITEMLQKRKPKFIKLRVDEDKTWLEEYEYQSNFKVTEKAFSISAPKLWNKLPKSIRNAESVVTFKKHLKTYLFGLAYD